MELGGPRIIGACSPGDPAHLLLPTSFHAWLLPNANGLQIRLFSSAHILTWPLHMLFPPGNASFPIPLPILNLASKVQSSQSHHRPPAGRALPALLTVQSLISI